MVELMRYSGDAVQHDECGLVRGTPIQIVQAQAVNDDEPVSVGGLHRSLGSCLSQRETSTDYNKTRHISTAFHAGMLYGFDTSVKTANAY
ncbi:MAG TPA: hypothetical protein VHY84_20885 [Bryobacteraceae bacterium]|nr:hypothetical protein [Bryobacteraceae bacterium]